MSKGPLDLLSPEHKRYVLFPIRHHEIWEHYRKAKFCNWTVEEVDLSADLKDWETLLKPGEKHFVTNVLAFFAASDGIVNENLVERFMTEVQPLEAKCFYGFQIDMENTHSHMYSLLIDTYVTDPIEKDRLFRAVEQDGAIKRKAEWALKWTHSDAPFAIRLVGYACVEGIFFMGSFCAIFWLKKRGLLPGLCKSNEFISRDEGLHRNFAILLLTLYNLLDDTVPFVDIVREAVEIEKQFVSESLPVSLIGMNAHLMCQFIECVADNLATSAGFDPIYGSPNPFDWMDLNNLDNSNNFFESRTTEYGNTMGGDLSFNIDC